MSLLTVIAISAVAVGFAILLAYLPMRILLGRMAKNIAAPIRAFIQRQRDRRAVARATPDRRRMEPKL